MWGAQECAVSAKTSLKLLTFCVPPVFPQGGFFPARVVELQAVFPSRAVEPRVPFPSCAPRPQVLALLSHGGGTPLFVFLVHAAGPQAYFDIPFPFDVSVPLALGWLGVGSSGHPSFRVAPSVDRDIRYSSSDEAVGQERVHGSSDVHANHGFDRILSSRDLPHNRNAGHDHNRPSPGYSNGTDTNDLARDATTSRPRKRGLHPDRDLCSRY